MRWCSSSTPIPPVPTALQFHNGDKINVDAGLIKAEDLLPSYDGLFTAEFVK